MQHVAEHANALHDAIFFLGCLAFITAAKLVDFRSSSHQRLALLAIVVLTGVAFYVTTPSTPPPDAVDGSYGNPCCGAIRLQGGVLITPHEKVPFKLELMKFGLVANLSVPVEVRGREVVAAQNASTSVLTFSENLRETTICGRGNCEGRQYQFVRM